MPACQKCGQVKPVSQFYASIKGRCKKCHKEAVANYAKANPRKIAAKNARYFLKIASTGSFTVNEWLELCDMHQNRCARCRKKVPLGPDHIKPLSKGGSNLIDNIQPFCGPCNSWKGTREVDFRRWRAEDPKTPLGVKDAGGRKCPACRGAGVLP